MVSYDVAQLSDAHVDTVFMQSSLQGQDSVSSLLPHRVLAFFSTAFSTYNSPIAERSSLTSCSYWATASGAFILRLCSPPFTKVSTHACISLGAKSFCRATSITAELCRKICKTISAFFLAVHRCTSVIVRLLIHYAWSEWRGEHNK